MGVTPLNKLFPSSGTRKNWAHQGPTNISRAHRVKAPYQKLRHQLAGSAIFFASEARHCTPSNCKLDGG